MNGVSATRQHSRYQYTLADVQRDLVVGFVKPERPGALEVEASLRKQRIQVVAGRARARIEAHLACDTGTQRGFVCHTISRTVSERTVNAILSRFGCPFTSDSANFVACSTVTFGGIGGVNGSTTASTSTGPSMANA